MKFGKTLSQHRDEQGSHYANFYMDYKGMKRCIKEAKAKGISAQPEVKEISEILYMELEKLNNASDLIFKTLNTKVDRMLAGRAPSEPSDVQKAKGEVEFMRSFMHINYWAFAKSTKKCDKVLGTAYQNWFMPEVVKSDFRNLDLDPILAKVMRMESGKTEPAPTAQAQAGTLQRKSRSDNEASTQTCLSKVKEKWTQLTTPVVNPNSLLRVDVKTTLSNERTAIRWLRTAVALASLSAFLLSREASAAKVDGLLLGCLALMFCYLPVKVFWKRSTGFSNTKLEMEGADMKMPQVLGGSVMFVFMTILFVDVFVTEREFA
mmetsp:Transcript_50996/g.119244  ORF Transcript_50996/g.119244 Transcript_50996/m.119244 type:complete len:320 (-) Transcript_50996:108-1067(-)